MENMWKSVDEAFAQDSIKQTLAAFLKEEDKAKEILIVWSTGDKSLKFRAGNFPIDRLIYALEQIKYSLLSGEFERRMYSSPRSIPPENPMLRLSRN